MRRILRTILLAGGFALAAQSASAEKVLHQWPVTDTKGATTILTAQGSASGRGLTLTIPPPVKLDGRDAPTTFDAEIERQLADADILDRKDVLRISFAGASMIYTTLEYISGSSGEKRITSFALASKTVDDAIHIIRADGPFDRKLMEHYSSDVLSIARDPAVAVAEKLEIKPHPSQKKSSAKTAKKAAKKAKTPKTKSASAKAPNGWTRKVYTDATTYWPAKGLLAKGARTGYLGITIYNPQPLKGRSLDAVLSDFTKDQERFYDVKRRENAIMDGPHRAWDFIRSRNKNNLDLNTSFLAIRTGDDTVRIVRETLTDDDHDERMDYLLGIEQLYRSIDNKTPAKYRGDTPPATTMHLMTKRLQTESSKERRARQKQGNADAKQRLLGAISSKPGEGIQLGEMTGVFLKSDFFERAYGGKNATYAVYILLKDGTAYRNPTRPPSDIDRAASRRTEASKWVEWRKSGAGYETRANASAPWKKLKGKLAKPAPASKMGFKGKSISAWGDILMGTAGHRTGSITLTRKGRFETSSFSLAGGGGLLNIPAATVSTSTGKNGRQSTTMSNVAPALLNNTNRDPDGTDFTGQYALKGYTAEFLSDSGKLNRSLFLMTIEGGVYVGGTYYSKPDK